MYWKRIATKPLQEWASIIRKFKEKKLNRRLPNRALTNIDIIHFTENIPYFRGVYMRDTLPRSPFSRECGIINLDKSKNSGTHWVAYVILNKYVEYFDSYGNLKPPTEFIRYVGSDDIHYNYSNFQNNNLFNCGHLCIQFLKEFWNKQSF